MRTVFPCHLLYILDMGLLILTFDTTYFALYHLSLNHKSLNPFAFCCAGIGSRHTYGVVVLCRKDRSTKAFFIFLSVPLVIGMLRSAA